MNIKNLELHITHSCNLSCESCVHYSNQKHTGTLSLETADEWFKHWSNRVSPTVFSILGGEPTIHPEFSKFIPLVRAYWPSTHIRLVTNGTYLHNHPELPQVMKDDRNTGLYLSKHHDSPEYNKMLEPIMGLIKQWIKDYGIRFVMYKSYEHWYRNYYGAGSSIEPFKDGKPEQSWNSCISKFCVQLHEGMLWKCPPIAYLGMQNEKYKLSDSWSEYLKYKPLETTATDAELSAFLQTKSIKECGMCPANPKKMPIPNP